MPSYDGQCLCGAVKFTASGVDPHFHACHCETCRRWSGGPLFATSANNVVFTGQKNLAVYNSSDSAERGFCKICGSNLFYRTKDGSQYAIPIGTFNDDTQFAMAGEIFFDLKPPGYAFTGDHERLNEEETLAKFLPS